MSEERRNLIRESIEAVTGRTSGLFRAARPTALFNLTRSGIRATTAGSIPEHEGAAGDVVRRAAAATVTTVAGVKLGLSPSPAHRDPPADNRTRPSVPDDGMER